METCLLCSEFKHKTGNDFICSSCVSLLLAAGQGDLQNAHAKAVEKGFKDKASAIGMFLGGNHGETEKPRSNLVRRRPMRKARVVDRQER